MSNDPSGAEPESDAQRQFNYMLQMERLQRELDDRSRADFLKSNPFYDGPFDPGMAAAYYGMQTEMESQRQAMLLTNAQRGDMNSIREYAAMHDGLIHYEGAEARALFTNLYAMEATKFRRRVPGAPTPSGGTKQGWWFDDQGELLFDHWRNGKGKELFLSDPKFWGDYMRAHAGLRDAIEYEIANKIGTHAGAFKGVMSYDFGGWYRTGYELLGGSNADVGGLSYTGDLTINGDELHYHVKMTWNDIMDPIDDWKDQLGDWLFPGTPYTVHISWTYDFTFYKLDEK